MSNLHNLQMVVIERSSTENRNRKTIKTKDTWFCEEIFIDRSFLFLEILKGALCDKPPPHPPPCLHKLNNPMVNRVNQSYQVFRYFISIICFYKLGFSFLYIHEKFITFFQNRNIIFKLIQEISSDFK